MKKIKKIVAIVMATMIVLALGMIYASAGDEINDVIGNYYVHGKIFMLEGSSTVLKGETSNHIGGKNGTPATCAVQLFALFPDSSYIFLNGNAGVGSIETSTSIYAYLNTMRYPFADHHYGENGVYYGVRSTELIYF